MKTILFCEQTLNQIKDLLLNDDIIRRLLYIQTPSALTHSIELTPSLVSNLIYTVPYVDDEGGIENSNKSNFIVIYSSYFNFSSNTENVINFSIDIFVNYDYYFIDNNKTRLMQLLNRVTDLLDNKKFSFSEKIKIVDAKLTSINNGKTIGYLTSWSVSDGTTIQY